MRVGAPSVSTLNQGQATPENSIKVFEIVILQLLEWLGVEWSDMQIRETAELMSSEYHWMSLAEIKGFTAKIKAGHFGKEWGKLRPMSLMGWMLDWSADLLNARAGKHANLRPELPEEGTIDITARLGPVMEQLQADLTQQREDERKEREAAIQARQDAITRHGVYVIAGRMSAGEKMNSLEEQAFYKEHKEAIDEAISLFRESKKTN